MKGERNSKFQMPVERPGLQISGELKNEKAEAFRRYMENRKNARWDYTMTTVDEGEQSCFTINRMYAVVIYSGGKADGVGIAMMQDRSAMVYRNPALFDPQVFEAIFDGLPVPSHVPPLKANK